MITMRTIIPPRKVFEKNLLCKRKFYFIMCMILVMRIRSITTNRDFVTNVIKHQTFKQVFGIFLIREP
jgi:hypothetical protein